jgi:hypothetical protein
MGKRIRTWLVCNPDSGGNDEEAIVQLVRALEQAGHDVARRIRFPEEAAPRPDELRAQRVDVLAVFAGDGTVHGVVTGAYGWEGCVLVLPGGTMNLLSKRLHGDIPALEIAERIARAQPRRVRPAVIRSRHGDGLSGVLAGPGAIWNEVREALRASNVPQILTTAKDAIAWSASGPKVICPDVDCPREEGYAAITVNPRESGLEVKGYYADTLGDYAGQGIALLNRNYRDGPHDELGKHGRVRLVCPEGEPMGLLIDGEPLDGGSEELFSLATCGVDLLETANAR